MRIFLGIRIRDALLSSSQKSVENLKNFDKEVGDPLLPLKSAGRYILQEVQA